MSTSTAEAVTVALTFVPTTGRPAQTVVVSATSATTWAQVRPLLPSPLGDTAWYADDGRVPDDATLGDAPLLHAAELTDRPRHRPPRSLLELAVAEGPDCGQVSAVRDHLVIGRAPESGLQVRDASMSRAHARVELEHGHVTVRDLGSTNGTWIEASHLEENPQELRVGQRLRTGNTVSRLSAVSTASPLPLRSGRRALSRPPRQVPQLSAVELTRPQPPQVNVHSIPWLMFLVPLPVALVLALVLRSPMFLAFAVFSPLMMVGHYLHDRIGGRRSRRVEEAAFRRRTAALEDEVASLLDQETRDRRRLAPDLAELAAGVRTGRCWARRPGDADHLVCRLGTGSIPAQTSVRGADGERETFSLEHVPIAVALGDHPVCGLAGSSDVLPRAVDGLVGQILSTHSPTSLRVLVVSHDTERWRWLAWTPHVRPDTIGAPLILHPEQDDVRLRSSLGPWTREPDRTILGSEPVRIHTLVLLDGAGLTHQPLLHSLVQHGRAHGIAVVAAAPTTDGLPADCTATAVYENDCAGRLLIEDGVQEFCPDLPAAEWRERLGRDLAGTLDTTPGAEGGEPPTQVRLLDLLDGPPRSDVLGDRWSRHPRSTEILLGSGADGPVTVDLVRDGPHALIGGTTGSGKSELLQTLITSLALGNRPDELTFLLVDYKGGAAFKDCVNLPHTVGLVTDLDPFLTQRALSSLEAEIRRRERLLAAAGAKDLEDYQAHAGGAHPTIPRLVLVIDEFRVLADELPDFIDGVVRLAAVGRSLGIHLVLATQRPAGIVSADIRANVNLRIALRVRDSSDSEDIIESSAAAQISTHTPGRALIRAGTTPPLAVQSARVSGSASVVSTTRVMPVDPSTARVLAAPAPDPVHGTSDLCRLVGVVSEAADTAQIPVVPSPWLPPLPRSVPMERCGPPVRLLDGAEVMGETPVAPLGILDLPTDQRQVCVGWGLGTGHLAIAGGPRSGRTTAVRTVAATLAGAWSADELHLYALDASGALGALRALPHTGAVIDSADSTQTTRMVSWLAQECTRRQHALAAGDLADLREQWSASSPEARVPHLVLVVDGWDSLQTEYELSDASVVEDLLQLLRDGPAVGLSVLLTGGRAVLSGRVSGLLQHRLVLRMADEMDVVMAGLRPSQVPPEMPPGRALLLPDGHELQLATLSEDLSGAAQSRSIREVADRSPAALRQRPKLFATLPEQITLGEAPAAPSNLEEGLWIGVGGEEAAPVRWEDDPAHGTVALVAGPPGSGRTTALQTLAAQLAEQGPVHWLACAGPPDTMADGVHVEDARDLPTMPQRLEDTFVTLVIDDAELLTEAQDDLALSFLGRCATGAGALLVAGTTSELMGSFRGVAHALRRRQSGLILRPSRGDGDLFATQVPHTGRSVPGRGVYLHRARATELQVFRPPTTAGPARSRMPGRHTGAVVG